MFASNCSQGTNGCENQIQGSRFLSPRLGEATESQNKSGALFLAPLGVGTVS